MNTSYIRPKSIADAIAILSDQSVSTRILMGGMYPLDRVYDEISLIDLQALGLDQIKPDMDKIEMGSMTTLQQVYSHETIPAKLKETIKIEAGQNVRNSLCLAGLIENGDGRSPVLTTLVAMDVYLTFEPGEKKVALADYRKRDRNNAFGLFITKVVFDRNIILAFESVARTPLDRPIICVSVAAWPDGRMRAVLGGYKSEPILAFEGYDLAAIIPEVRKAFAHADDEWATAEYRQEMAEVLALRCIEHLNMQREEAK